MKKIQDFIYINAKHYSEMSENDKLIIDKTASELIELEEFINFYEDKVINIITNDNRYHLMIQSELPEDLTGKILMAWIESKNNNHKLK